MSSNCRFTIAACGSFVQDSMAHSTADFYERLAEHYHLIFDAWEQAIQRQARVLNQLLESEMGRKQLKVLDCACGIGTQAIGFARNGHQVVASDLSHAAVARAKREAEARRLQISFHVSDMTDLMEIEANAFDVVASVDNALPHLSREQVQSAIQAMRSKLKPGGLFLASIRDYDKLIVERPVIHGPAFYGAEGNRRIVQQVWDWTDESTYVLHLYITAQDGDRWRAHHFASEYRCLKRAELTRALESEGFEGVRWVMPDESGFYQPLVLARRR